MFRFDCTFSNFNCTKRVQLHTILRNPPFSFVRGQDSTMWDIIWVSPQGQISVCKSPFPSAGTAVSLFTGFVLLSASISNWQSLYTELCTALHLDTCLTFFAALLTCRLVVVYGRRLPANLMSARRVSELSETVHLPLLGQSSGTVSLMTLHRLHIAASFQKETENSLISAILSGHYFVVCYSFLSPSWSLKLFVT